MAVRPRLEQLMKRQIVEAVCGYSRYQHMQLMYWPEEKKGNWGKALGQLRLLHQSQARFVGHIVICAMWSRPPRQYASWLRDGAHRILQVP